MFICLNLQGHPFAPQHRRPHPSQTVPPSPMGRLATWKRLPCLWNCSFQAASVGCERSTPPQWSTVPCWTRSQREREGFCQGFGMAKATKAWKNEWILCMQPSVARGILTFCARAPALKKRLPTFESFWVLTYLDMTAKHGWSSGTVTTCHYRMRATVRISCRSQA